MDKTERTIAKVTNAGRILSRIAWIFDLIACGCSAFLILAALLWWNTRPDLFTGYASQTGALLICAGDLIGCAGSAVLAYFARQHFAHALEAQTPVYPARGGGAETARHPDPVHFACHDGAAGRVVRGVLRGVYAGAAGRDDRSGRGPCFVGRDVSLCSRSCAATVQSGEAMKQE